MDVRDTPAFRLEGDLDMGTSDRLVDRVLGAARSGPVLLDLSNVRFIDSSGIHALLRIASALGDRGCVILHGEGRAVARVLDLVGIDRPGANLHRLRHGNGQVASP